MTKSTISAKWSCFKIPRMLIFQKPKPRRVLQDTKELFRIRKRTHKLFRVRKWKYKFPRVLLQGTFFKNLPPQNKLIFLMKSKMDFFQKSWFSIDFYWSKSLFHWKSKWCAWSIGTFSTIRIWKFRMETKSNGGKVTFSRGRKSRNSGFEVQNLTFPGCFETNTTSKNILEPPALVPAQFPYIKSWF